jgi:hypothetical protein
MNTNTQNTAAQTETAAPAPAAETAVVKTAINSFDSTPGLGTVGRPPLKIAVKNIPNILNLFNFAAPSQSRKLTEAEIQEKVKGMSFTDMLAYIQTPKNLVENVSAGIKTLKEWKAEAPEMEVFITKTQLKAAMAELVDNVWVKMSPPKEKEVVA